MTRRDRTPRQRLDAARRRELILAAAVREFSARPYEQVSVAAVAAEAAASEALVYRYFPTKEALFGAAVEAAVAELLERQDAADEQLTPHAPGEDRLRASLHVYLDWIEERAAAWGQQLEPESAPRAAVVAVRARATDAYVDRLRTAIGCPPGPPFDYALRGYLAFVDAACLTWIRRERPPAERRLIVEQCAAVLRAALAVAHASAGAAP